MWAKECFAIPSKVIATCFALIGFSAAILVGSVSGNSTGTVLFRAMMVMLVGYPIGRLVGLVAQRTIEESIASYRTDHPIPDELAEVGSSDTPSTRSPGEAPTQEQPT